MNNLNYIYQDSVKIQKISELTHKLKFNFILKSDLLCYDFFDIIREDFISTKFNLKIPKNKAIIELAGLEMHNSILLEKLFLSHFNNKNEDLIMIYCKNSPQISYYLKSYQVINKDKIDLPFFKTKMPVNNNLLNNYLKDGEIMISCL